MESKQELRSRLLSLRRGLSPDQRSEWSRRIAKRVVTWSLYREAGTVHCFRSMVEMGEVETDLLFKQMWEDGKRVVVPRTDEDGMASVQVTPDSVWERHPLGMLEPAGGVEVSPTEIDMVLVPLLAADRRGHRLGYGKGMYDRFLSRTTGRRVGLLFSDLLLEEWLPNEEHDVPLDWIVTESYILACGATNNS